MALQKTLTYKGLTIPNAYCKVWRIEGDKTEISFGLGVYAAQNGERIYSETHTFDYNLNGDNPIKQAYLYLKNTPEFSGSSDV
jgi:hypothetical protein